MYVYMFLDSTKSAKSLYVWWEIDMFRRVEHSFGLLFMLVCFFLFFFLAFLFGAVCWFHFDVDRRLVQVLCKSHQSVDLYCTTTLTAVARLL